MNLHSPQAFQIDLEIFGAERAVIARCLAEPALIAQAAARLSPAEFAHPFLGEAFRVLVDLHDTGRKPSMESLIAVFADDEVEAGLKVRDCLTRIVRASLYGQFLPIDDAIEVIRDAAARNVLAKIAEDMRIGAGIVRPVIETALDATARLDELVAMSRAGERQTFDSAGIASTAFDHLDSTDVNNPTTGLKDLDDVLGGWPKGELSVVAARPGMGKSAFATSALLRAAKARRGCLFFSLEMTATQIGARLLTDLAFTADNPIFYEDVLKKRINPRQRERLQQAKAIVDQLPLTIEVERGLTVTDVAVRSRKLAAQYERDGGSLEVIFVDHMLLLRASQRYSGNRVREVAEISDGLASLAKELNVAVVALCQLNRQVEGRENKRPGLSDLRDSGAIEEDASTVTFLYRPAYYLERQQEEGEAELKRQDLLEMKRNDLEFIVAKNRNGRVETVNAFVNIGANAIRNKAYG
jgi:replicative DNA helicase